MIFAKAKRKITKLTKKGVNSKAKISQGQEIEELLARTTELDRVAKMLVRRDLELSEVRMQREEEVEELKAKTSELEETRRALLNMLEDTDAAKLVAEESRKKTELIIRDLSDGLLILGANKVVEFLNPEAERLLFLQQKEVVGKQLKDLLGDSSMKALAQLLQKEGGQIFRKELKIEGQRVIEVTSTPFHLRKEAPSIIIVFHDITREREIERMKTEFVSLAAHQLRTPLAAIKWSTQMLLDGDEGPLSKGQGELLQKSFLSTDRMIRLINDLLNITRIEEGRYLYQPTFQQISEILKSMVKLYQDTAQLKKVNLEVKFPSKDPPKVLVDAEKMQLAIQNLLENSLHYTPVGGKVTVQISYDTKEVEISFTDTGIGIPQKQQSRVFGKFFRASNAKVVDTDGSGLGLYLVRNIVEAHGGKVWFESKEGEGSTFTLSLPIKEEISEFVKKF